MNLNIKHKLLLTVLIPIIGLFILASIEVQQKIGQYNETIAAINAVELSIKASELVHQLQKERGMTAGFLGSKGQKFSTELQLQRQQTNQNANQLKGFVSQFDFSDFESELEVMVTKSLSSFDQTSSNRRAVDNFTIATPDALAAYTALNSQLLSLVNRATKQTSNDQLNKANMARSVELRKDTQAQIIDFKQKIHKLSQFAI